MANSEKNILAILRESSSPKGVVDPVRKLKEGGIQNPYYFLSKLEAEGIIHLERSRGKKPRILKAILRQEAAPQDLGETAVLIDYDNLMIRLKLAGVLNFPGRKILKGIQAAYPSEKIGLAMAFVPNKGLSPDDMMEIAREGFYIMTCPPTSPGGGDTVDKRLEEFAKFLVLMTKIKKIVLATADNHFIDLINFLALSGKEYCLLSLGNGGGRNLKDSANGKIISLSVEGDIQDKLNHKYAETNIYEEIISKLLKKEDVFSDSRIGFLKAVIYELPKLNLEKRRLGFINIRSILEQYLFVQWGQRFNRNEYTKVVSALAKTKVLIQRSESVSDGDRKFYVLNSELTEELKNQLI